MYRTQSNVIRGLSKQEYFLLSELCRFSNNLHNVALYNVRQHFFNEGKFLRYEANYHVCKTNENYVMLQAGAAQQTIKVVERNFKSFFSLLKKARTNEYRYADIGLPGYREKGGMFPLVMSTNAISVKNGYFQVPVSQRFKREYGNDRIHIPFPDFIDPASLKEVRIVPHYKGRYFTIEYCYEAETENLHLDESRCLAIDIGLDNLATCIDSDGTPFIMDGRNLKSINHRYNKELARLKSIADRQGTRTTKRIQDITRKRNNRVKDCMRKTARYIVNHCIENDIGTAIVGYNIGFKQDLKLHRKTRQQFVQVPFGQLRNDLSNLCERYGMRYIEQEESYTSKASFMDLDGLPVYNASNPKKYSFSGRKTYRGLYITAGKHKVNADVNGACNIYRKSKQNFDFGELCKGLLASPQRIRLT